MHHSQTRFGRSIPSDSHYAIRGDVSESLIPVYSEILKHLFFPYREYQRLTRSQRYQNRSGLAWLKRLVYTREGSHIKTDITSLAPSATRFSAVFNTGELGVGTPSLGIRLEQVHHISSHARFGNNGRMSIVAETKLPLYDIKSMTVRRIVEDDYIRADDNGYMGQDPTQEDYIYEVTLHILPYGNRRLTPSQYYRDHVYENAARCLKDLHKHAESIKFCIVGPRESWTKLKMLQTDLGLRGDWGNSSNTISVGSDNRSGRMGARRVGGAINVRDSWETPPSFEDDDDLIRGDWVNVRVGGRYGYRDGYRECDVDYAY